MNNLLDKMKNTRLLATIGIIGLVLGTILPYVSIWGFSISLWGYWEGIVIIILAIANFLFIFRDIVEKYIPAIFETDIGKKFQSMDNPKYSLVPTILVVIFAAYEAVELGMGFKYYSLGFYCLWIGVISLVAYAIMHKPENNNNVYQDNNYTQEDNNVNQNDNSNINNDMNNNQN